MVTTTVADISVAQFLQTPLIQGVIEVQPFNAREVAKRIGVEWPEMAKADALQQVGLKTAIKLQGEKLEANDFSLLLDSSTLSGWLHVIDLTKQQLRYDLVLNQINLNDYLAPVVEQFVDTEVSSEQGSVAAKVSLGAAKIVVPVDMIRDIDGKRQPRFAYLTSK